MTFHFESNPQQPYLSDLSETSSLAGKMVWGQLQPQLQLTPALKLAFERLPRADFVPPSSKEYCYCDGFINLVPPPTTEKSTYASTNQPNQELVHELSSQALLGPLTLARLLLPIARMMTSSTNNKDNTKALILSGGTGYSTGLLAAIGVECHMVEPENNLREQANHNLHRHQLNIVNKNIKMVNIYASTDYLANNQNNSGKFDFLLVDGGAIKQLPIGWVDWLAPKGFAVFLRIVTSQENKQANKSAENINSNYSSLTNQVFCQGIKTDVDANETILFETWAPKNRSFTIDEFEF